MFNNKLAVLLLLPSIADVVSAGVLVERESQVERRDTICGVKGYDKGQGNYDYSKSSKYASYAGCSAHCLASSACKSFGYSGRECMLFDVALASNFDADNGSDDIYYDRDCVSSVSVPASSSVVISSPATGSTKAAAAVSSSSTAAKTSSSLSSTTRQKPSSTSLFPVGGPSSAGSSSLTTVTPSSVFLSSLSGAATSSGGSAVSTGTPTSSAASTVSIPPDCAPYLTTSFQLTSLTWFNSTNNLDCVDGGHYGADAKVCVNAATNTLCDASAPGCTCVPYCAPTAPSAAFQPPGFGPPDNVTVAIAGWQYPSCTQANPMTPATGVAALPLAEVGDGNVDCGPKHNYLNFFGDSNPGREQGRLLFIPGSSCHGHQALFEATFPLTCTRDAGGNATCVPSGPVTLPLTRFSTAQCSSCAGSQIQ